MSTLDWSDDEIVENDIKQQPSRDLPPSEDEEDEYNYREILNKNKKNIDITNFDNLHLERTKTIDRTKIKKKEIKPCLLQTNMFFNTKKKDTTRKFNPRLPPPEKYKKN